MKSTILVLTMIATSAAAQEKGPVMEFPAAQKIPHVMKIHGDSRIDNYFWMKERDTKPVLDFLKQENKRTELALKPVAKLEKKLFQEMKSRIKEDDATVPVEDSGYFYYSRVVKGGEYRVHCRKKGSLRAKEEIIFDENKAAKGHKYFDVNGVEVSQDHNILGYAVDTVGRRFHSIHFKNLKSGKALPDKIEDVSNDFVIAPDNKTVFYVRQDPETLRSYQVYSYQLGSKKPATLVFEEKDVTYSVGLDMSKTKNFIFMASYKRDSTEFRVLDAKNLTGEFQIFWPREKDHEYSIEDAGDRFYILTNWKAKNFRLMETAIDAWDRKKWKEVIAHDPKIYREGIDVYDSNVVISERENGLTRLTVMDRKSGATRQVQFDDPAYDVTLNTLPDYFSKYLRFDYQSFVQPPAIYDEDFATRKRVLRKEKEVPGFKKNKYETQRIWATAKDGVKIPISVLKLKANKPNGKSPGLVYGYGSYGISMDVQFWSTMLSLVDRGFVLAVAHIRGGSEMGREWYESGRLKNKMNTFTDFIAATEKLVADGLIAKDRVHMMGGSAGGLLMGAVMNLRPDLYKSVLPGVPFVDVLTTMLDDSIPLTTSEYNEWGDPRVKADYMYMRQYSPYDNVAAKDYPHVFVTTGYHDSQVQYWEPAKWVAKLRELKTDKNLLLLYTEMKAGHSGASGRFEFLKNYAKQFAFVLMVEGIKE